MLSPICSQNLIELESFCVISVKILFQLCFLIICKTKLLLIATVWNIRRDKCEKHRKIYYTEYNKYANSTNVHQIVWVRMSHAFQSKSTHMCYLLPFFQMFSIYNYVECDLWSFNVTRTSIYFLYHTYLCSTYSVTLLQASNTILIS